MDESSELMKASQKERAKSDMRGSFFKSVNKLILKMKGQGDESFEARQ